MINSGNKAFGSSKKYRNKENDKSSRHHKKKHEIEMAIRGSCNEAER